MRRSRQEETKIIAKGFFTGMEWESCSDSGLKGDEKQKPMNKREVEQVSVHPASQHSQD